MQPTEISKKELNIFFAAALLIFILFFAYEAYEKVKVRNLVDLTNGRTVLGKLNPGSNYQRIRRLEAQFSDSDCIELILLYPDNGYFDSLWIGDRMRKCYDDGVITDHEIFSSVLERYKVMVKKKEFEHFEYYKIELIHYEAMY